MNTATSETKKSITASWFSRFAKWSARQTARPLSFVLASGLIVAWMLTGFVFDFSDTWQLIINTATTIVTFLMVFVIQNTQNRDTEAIQIKLDELIRSTQGAHNVLLDLEELDEEVLDKFRAQYEKLALKSRHALSNGGVDIDTPEIKNLGKEPDS
ncbi:MAG TPA: low affinity iron permease family protein [Methylophilaceae bacterium]|jgi:low affinity Fe/Cu permease|nr:low affinity iron permease family protein [Methylophilaceae bacterium]